jgi:transposase
MLLNFLDDKLEREGGKLVEVDRFYPSTKLCSCCGFKNDWLFWFLCGNEVYTDSFFRKIALKVLSDKYFTIP